MKNPTKHSSANCVLEIDTKLCREKRLWDHFHNGIKAIHLANDTRFETLWIKVNEFLTSDGSSPFWEDSISVLSKNHITNRSDLGDMIRFFPSAWGHYARKMILLPNEKTKEIKVYPDKFITNKGRIALSQDVLKLAWEIATEIYLDCLPKGFKPPEYAVCLQILKYPDSKNDFNKTFNLIEESNTGYWTKLGQRLDRIRNNILNNSPFNPSFISKLYWYISKVPIFNLVLIPINKLFFGSYAVKLPNHEIIGPAHVDSTRAFTMLMGNRDVIVTEVYDHGSWHEIEFSSKSMHVFPGEYLNEELGIKPTYHRYSISQVANQNSHRKPNISLLLGIVDPSSVGS